MKTKFIEAMNGTAECRFNWGKFLVARFDAEEWSRQSCVDGYIMLPARGWTPDNIFVLDLQTGEGAIFRPGGSAWHDLEKHKIWVCPLFCPFLEWLYKQDLTNLDALPGLVELGNVPGALAGYRRPGPKKKQTAA